MHRRVSVCLSVCACVCVCVSAVNQSVLTCGRRRRRLVLALVADVVEVDEEVLVLLEDVVVNDADLDVSFRLARLEDESARRELVVGPGVRRPVLGPVVHVRRRRRDVAALHRHME